MPSTPFSRVLCVDDDRDACEMLSELLKLSGIKCVCASSAEEARRLINIQRFDLYVLDAWLPTLDGFEFCREIRMVDSTTPILFYSGAGYDSDKQKGIAAGANAYMVKPDVDSLLETMSSLIAEARIVATKKRFTALELLKDANRHVRSLDASPAQLENWSDSRTAA
jgi:DNA-binding response OmpR family regulator